MEKAIEGFENYYKISDTGIVTSIRKNKTISQHLSRKGYYVFTVSMNGFVKTMVTHRQVAISFIPNPQNKPQVNHINGIKTDNRAENLEWVTCSENLLHAYTTGLKSSKGEKNSFSILTEKQVLEIREAYKIGKPKLKDMALKYRTSISNICAIKTRQNWKHV